MTSPARPAARPQPLSELARATGLAAHGEDVMVHDLCADSRLVQPGDLFVAVPGSTHDGARFLADAVRAGAAAVCAAAPLDGVPTLVADSPRAALADLAAAFLGHPTRDVWLVGVTGSLGKTSTALLTQACMAGGGLRAGVIGSLGVRARGIVHDTGMTTPDALTLQRELRWMADEGVGVAIMEVSSHGLLLDRVRGIELALGIFTNLVPDEHLEFHPTPEHYVRTKLRFLELLRDGAPLIYNADDPLVRDAAVKRTAGPAVGVGTADRGDAAVLVRDAHSHAGGGDFTLVITRALRTTDGAPIAAGEHRFTVPLLGRQQVDNAALAVTAALVAGVPVDDVARGLAAVAPIRRRMEIVHPAAPLVIDDTVGNPRSIRQVQGLVTTLPARTLRIAYAVRGTRGPTINEHCAEAIADLVQATDATRVRLVLTASTDSANARNRVTDQELEATVAVLRARGVRFDYQPTLRAAVHATLRHAADDDIVLLLGAQGMDDGAALVREAMETRDDSTLTNDHRQPSLP
jgi:UDP-N-acetylmuramoyl-L-alanyl-D-glutamate--2,6-diaminopimelate ligase